MNLVIGKGKKNITTRKVRFEILFCSYLIRISYISSNQKIASDIKKNAFTSKKSISFKMYYLVLFLKLKNVTNVYYQPIKKLLVM